MNKRYFLSIIGTIVVCIITSCGGGKSNSPSSDNATTKKGLFADVMTLIQEYQDKNEELSIKMQAAVGAQDADKLEKLLKEEKTLKPEFNEKLAALSKKLTGTPIDYELPDSFFFQIVNKPTITEVTPNGLNATGHIQLTIASKKDLNVGKYKGDDYRVYIKLIDDAGNTLSYNAYPTVKNDLAPQVIKAGQILEPINIYIVLSLHKRTTQAHLAKIVFVTEKEWQETLKH